ncbi:pyridoxine/pyridoxal/pyridoxamine kinase [Bordetella bronchiseptica]|uniref:pyridoxine/pyridoxal/pyridoxamine kinase n=1 Tax=Bordetella bronchiseptica TaxID=518 RepID=UPI000460EE5E|nr:pyridoxine/pyridoxal/pyridoxamine kinase [Bordetella bronchiseptica]AWQ05334.1 bifunctional pyridoxal kinase/hydroxymethylpyrimidine kinase [Bordetella bronchiseptica]KDD13269.1 pyridoxal-pyridoxamine kinase/hydroxymethylpyrimidine kinase [Bordetella bronchiseptica MBORD707]KDD53165.1 pyridoxal-pyridoxamine kinase/hydroxymethylpyrimidine kinase [Bordetella bronchiseptica OSU553]
MMKLAAPNPQALAPLPIDVVSIQSQVVYGQVGNSVAVPVFNGFGLRVAAVPTVVLSNTPHYPSMHGGAVPLDWFEGYLADLGARGALAGVRVVQLGYLGGPAQAEALGRWIAGLVAVRPDLRVHIDPVIGDHDSGVYVAPGMVAAYRDHLLPLAQGLTPNGFELECLTGLPTGTMEQTIAAARTLLGGRARWVIVTSAAPATWPPGRVRVAVVTHDDAQVLDHAHVDTAPKGTGDMFGAALTGHLLAGQPVAEAARRAALQVIEALERTREAGCGELLLAGPLR